MSIHFISLSKSEYSEYVLLAKSGYTVRFVLHFCVTFSYRNLFNVIREVSLRADIETKPHQQMRYCIGCKKNPMISLCLFLGNK